MPAPLRRLAALVAVLLIGAPAAVAQPTLDLTAFPQVRPGQTVNGTLSASGPEFSHRGAFTVHRFDAQEGERYLIDLRSTAFDAYLTLMRPAGPLTELVREDDDGGEETDARIRFRADRSGPYLLVVQGFADGSAGPYSLSLQQLPPPVAAVPRPIQVGAIVQARLADGDPLLPQDEYDYGYDAEVYHHLYQIEARAGQSLLITMDSDDFDAFLQFGPLQNGEVMVTDVDDDGGEGTNASLRVTVPASGTYGIQARSFGEQQTGAYTLRVQEWTPPPVTTRAIAPGRSVTAELTTADAEHPEHGYVQHWTFDGRAGDRVRVTMRSGDFDTYLIVGQLAGGAFNELAYNDDFDGTDSMVELTLPAGGQYVVQATSFGAGATGTYTLHVEPLSR